MAYQDKSIVCSDCGATFTFTAGEQESFAQRGYTNEPKRCMTCRASRKQQQGDRGGGSSYNSGSRGGSYNSAPRQMFPAVCSDCGKACEVPFEPRNGKPVYCRDCYNKLNPRK
jgi:CxxC-x17-CxxC domain-containing protein